MSVREPVYKGYWSLGDILCVKDFIEKIIPYISLNSCKTERRITLNEQCNKTVSQ